MKILYIYNRYQQEGGENLWVESEPDLLRARGHEVFVYRRDNAEIEQFSPWKKASLLWRARWSTESYLAVRALIRRERPAVAHVYNTVALVSPSVYYACRAEGVPVVQTLYNYRLLCPVATLLRNGRICEECVEHSLWRSVRHGCYRTSRLQSAALAWTLHSHRELHTWEETIDCYLVPTEFMRQKLVEGGLSPEKIQVKPNYHDPDPGLRGVPDGSAIYVGRLASEKGLRTLLSAWRLLGGGVVLRIIGDGPLRAEVEAAAALPGAGIQFLGTRPHSEVISYLKKATMSIVPSEWYEAFPHVILEAYACGLPVVASRLGTLTDVVTDGETGLLFAAGQAADLAAKVNWLMSNSDCARRMGLAARSRYLKEYTADRNYERLMGTYRTLLTSRKGANHSSTRPTLA